MGVAYFIVLDAAEPGFDTFVNGKAVAHARDSICAITESLGLKGIDDLTSFGELDEEFDVLEEYREKEEPWFTVDEGLKWSGAIRAHIEANPSTVSQPDRVVSDLREYELVLHKAAGIGAKWHFQMDV